jgi:hypothetical protein
MNICAFHPNDDSLQNVKLADMKSAHLIIPDLFLPKDFAAEVCAELRLPALEKLLGRGRSEILEPVPLENLLCEMFGMSCQADAPIAPVSAAFDGLGAGCWLRADPVHLNLQRDQLLLLQNMEISADEAGQMCASLNKHFAGQGMVFFAPHPQRWYVRLDELPDIETVPLSQALGRNVHGLLPRGAEAMRWHQVFNEIQMLLFAHPLNESRDARGALPINSVWLWGGGGAFAPLQKNYQSVHSDDALAEMFAAAAGIPFAAWSEQWGDAENNGKQLLVWTGLRSALRSGDLAAWRTALQDFENGYARPLWQALSSGKIARLQIDILSGDSIRRVLLTRGDTWAFWRRAKRLAEYSLT